MWRSGRRRCRAYQAVPAGALQRQPGGLQRGLRRAGRRPGRRSRCRTRTTIAPSGPPLLDWLDFLKSGAPLAALSADTAETRYRAWAQNRYALPAAQAAALPLPIREADWAYVRAHAAPLRWGFITRNYALVVAVHRSARQRGLGDDRLLRAGRADRRHCQPAVRLRPVALQSVLRQRRAAVSARDNGVSRRSRHDPELPVAQELRLPEHVLCADPARARPAAFRSFCSKASSTACPKNCTRPGRWTARANCGCSRHHAAAVQAHLRGHRAGGVYQRLRGVSVCHAHLPGPRHVDTDGLAVRDVRPTARRST